MQVKNKSLGWRQVLRKEHPFLGLLAQDHSFFANGVVSGELLIQMGLQN